MNPNDDADSIEEDSLVNQHILLIANNILSVRIKNFLTHTETTNTFK